MRFLKTKLILLSLSIPLSLNGCKFNNSSIKNNPIISDLQYIKVGNGYKSIIGTSTYNNCMKNEEIIEEKYTPEKEYKSQTKIIKVNNKKELLANVFKTEAENIIGADLFYLGAKNKNFIQLDKSKLLEWINSIPMHKWGDYYLISKIKIVGYQSLKEKNLSEYATRLLDTSIKQSLKNKNTNNNLNVIDKTFYNNCGDKFISKIYLGFANYFVIEIPKVKKVINGKEIWVKDDIWSSKLPEGNILDVESDDNTLIVTNLNNDPFIQTFQLELKSQNRVIKLFKAPSIGIGLDQKTTGNFGSLGSFGISNNNTYSGKTDLFVIMEHLYKDILSKYDILTTVEDVKPVFVAAEYESYAPYINNHILSNYENINLNNFEISQLSSPSEKQLAIFQHQVNNKFSLYEYIINLQMLINNLSYATQGTAHKATVANLNLEKNVWQNFIPWAEKYYNIPDTELTAEKFEIMHNALKVDIIHYIENILIPELASLSNKAYKCLANNDCDQNLDTNSSAWKYSDIYMFNIRD